MTLDLHVMPFWKGQYCFGCGMDEGTRPNCHGLQYAHYERLISLDRAAAFFHIQMGPTNEPYSKTHFEELVCHPLELQHLHLKEVLFQKPSSLAPPRTIDHSIHLRPNFEPMNVKPFHYLF
ncbi:hypothetical protein CR513_31968, partial [Mucuna pruriens]